MPIKKKYYNKVCKRCGVSYVSSKFSKICSGCKITPNKSFFKSKILDLRYYDIKEKKEKTVRRTAS